MDLELDKYTKEERIISIKRANIVAIFLMIGLFLLVAPIYYILWKENMMKGFNFSEGSLLNLIYQIGFIVMLTLIHEFLHVVGFIIAPGVGLKDTKIGVFWKKLTPYAHCKVHLRLDYYKFALLLPNVALGVVPLMLGIIIGSNIMAFWGGFMFVCGVGDFMILNLLRGLPKDTLVSDHPSEGGCLVYLPEK
ncbi:DUF3267 domain-containing protein [Alkaliphilus serpentinus]|uniref:DUF3267 domain-containing protein n=1 Tax=Alkaliphilus serpentinus TaxID=1482731 RepID=A0A833HQE5_9FIRM|nr:DUF3267 domain-containing protein [Alkaliphilus serpentinus]KAB3531782.1 DUF3267 domain-containing protein [Alkaliphilus serpentinus]